MALLFLHEVVVGHVASLNHGDGYGLRGLKDSFSLSQPLVFRPSHARNRRLQSFQTILHISLPNRYFLSLGVTK
jgi:hypothetical protein